MPPTTPTADGPRDVTQNCSVEELLKIRQHALDLATSRPPANRPGSETDAQRRQRITADADTYVKFMLAGRVYGS